MAVRNIGGQHMYKLVTGLIGVALAAVVVLERATRAGDLPKRSSRRGFFRLCERAMALRMPVAGAGEAGFHSWAADGLSGAILALSDWTTLSVRCNGKARNGRKLVNWSADRAWDTARLRHRDGSDGVPRPMRETPAVCYSYPTRLPGLIAACAGFFGLARRRRKETA
jgi:hypothetical protein